MTIKSAEEAKKIIKKIKDRYPVDVGDFHQARYGLEALNWPEVLGLVEALEAIERSEISIRLHQFVAESTLARYREAVRP